MIPDLNELLIERILYRGEFSWFVFPFAGRMAHEGLAALLSYRISLKEPMTIAVSFNDYGLQLRTNSSWDISLQEWREFLSSENLIEDLLACVNATELARRQFREVARVAGLIFSGYPKAKKAARHIQASSDLLFEVFQQYDTENLLLHQSRCEVLERHLELRRLTNQLLLIREQNICIEKPDRLTPFSFPLWADSLRAQISSEKWEDRIRKMVSSLEGNVA
jgi:ATP-dependent Lhr-like helicase